MSLKNMSPQKISSAEISVVFGADHAGKFLKDYLAEQLSHAGYRVTDVGTYSEERCDYPDFADKVAAKIIAKEALYGILVCGTGIGISIAANRHPQIRCACVGEATAARLSREHNDANVLALGARLIGTEVALDAALTFLRTEFSGGRHQKRIEKLGRPPLL